MKLRDVKVFTSGVLITVVTLTAIMAFAAPGVMREVFYGINVVVNGRTVEFEADSQPFITEGRTFLPVRAISEALGYPVNWDGYTQTVFIGVTPGETRLMTDIPPTNRQSMATGANARAVINGHEYFDAIISTNFGFVTSHQTHNLGGQFRELTGLFGIIDGETMGPQSVTLSFIAEGERTLAEFEMIPGALPTAISVDVTGVHLLTIEISHTTGTGASGRRNVALVNTTLN